MSVASGAKDPYSYCAIGKRAIARAAVRPTGNTLSDQVIIAIAAAASANRPSNISSKGETPRYSPQKYAECLRHVEQGRVARREEFRELSATGQQRLRGFTPCLRQGVCAEGGGMPDSQCPPRPLDEFRESGREDVTGVSVMQGSPKPAFTQLITTKKMLKFVVHLERRSEKAEKKRIYSTYDKKYEMRGEFSYRRGDSLTGGARSQSARESPKHGHG